MTPFSAEPGEAPAEQPSRIDSRGAFERPSSSADAMRWSEPFERLSVGQRFHTAERLVAEADVIAFSALTGDRHPQHCDADWAARSPFGERIAHGMLTLSLAVGLVPLDPDFVLALRRVGDVVFKRPVRLNESIHVDGELASLRALDRDAGLVEFSWAVRNQEGLLVCRASVQVLWRRACAAPKLGASPAEDGAITPARAPAGRGQVSL